MLSVLHRYFHWLHRQWPAGTVEKLPAVNPDGSTNVAGLYIVGDLTGLPLLKFAADSGARAVRVIENDPAFAKRKPADAEIVDLAIIGAGVSGIAAALEAGERGLSYRIYEATEVFSTLANFPAGKPIFTYPTEMTPVGPLQFREGQSGTKEELLTDLKSQLLEAGITPIFRPIHRISKNGRTFTVLDAEGVVVGQAHRVIVGIGRSGNFRKLGIPGEGLDKVFNRLHDPQDFRGKSVLVVGGGDSALETALALTGGGSAVTLSSRKSTFNRPKPENLAQLERLVNNSSALDRAREGGHPPGALRLLRGSEPKEIRRREVVLTKADGADETIANDAVFVMIGREPPLDFFRRSAVKIRGEWHPPTYRSFLFVMLLMIFIYHWKKGGTFFPVHEFFSARRWFPFNVPDWWGTLGSVFNQPAHLLGTLKITVGEPGFYYSFVYCLAVFLFGLKRIRRRRTPYVTRQTILLAAVQIIPLFLIPYLLLPWAGNNGWFDSGGGRWFADEFFPAVNYGHGREYWRAFGFVLAWPLFFWNVFTAQPLWGWLGVSCVQTFIIIPLLVRRFGKGAYCGWICSCGALAETLGDAQRHKMPHGPRWNRLNLLGQVFLLLSFILLLTRALAWAFPDSIWSDLFHGIFKGLPALNYVWFVDLFWAGILGVGCYWHFSGRIWCRFACPLAALMHLYARFARFRIFADKKKCISCNVCTSVCHQGIDVMNFANKGIAMEDPQCVRCAACVQSCPTGVLTFGRLDHDGNAIPDRLRASPVQQAELTVQGRKLPS